MWQIQENNLKETVKLFQATKFFVCVSVEKAHIAPEKIILIEESHSSHQRI